MYVMNKIQLWNMIPVPFYGPWTPETQAKMYYMWSASYLSLASHLGTLSLGVLAYLCLSSPSCMQALTRCVNLIVFGGCDHLSALHLGADAIRHLVMSLSRQGNRCVAGIRIR